jgi:peptidoglycan/LPS O-acetylase OafA/YrhL
LRLAVWLAADIATILRFQGHIAYGYTLPVFSLLAYYWIMQEIMYYIDKKEYKLLQFGGDMSYSLYLIHAFILNLVAYYTNTELHHSMNGWLCILAIVLSLVASYIFYLLVEKPSHKLARAIKMKK